MLAHEAVPLGFRVKVGHPGREQREDVDFLDRVARREVLGEEDGRGGALLLGEVGGKGGGGGGVEEGPGLAEGIVLGFFFGFFFFSFLVF